MATESLQTTPRKPTARARTTNGSVLLDGDNRSIWARRCRDIIAEYCVDLGGPELVTTAELAIIRRIAVITTELEQMELAFATTGSSYKAIDLYSRTSGNLRRMIESIGTKRRPKPVPDLSDLIAGSSMR